MGVWTMSFTLGFCHMILYLKKLKSVSLIIISLVLFDKEYYQCNSLKKEHFIPLLYDVCKWETTYKVACFTLMLYLSSHKVLMDFIKWHTQQYTHILDLCNWIKGHRARIMRRRVPVAGRARIMRRRLPVAGRARQARGQKSKLYTTFFREYVLYCNGVDLY